MYGIGPTRSTAGPRSLSGCTTEAPGSGSPTYRAAMASTRLSCSSGGTNGSGGAVISTHAIDSSSGAASAQSRHPRSASGAGSIGNIISPASTIGPSRCRRNSNSVTIPKFPPPPRTPQNRSGCSSALARKTPPSASTTSAEIRLSQANPYFDELQPYPPPRVNPPIPVVVTRPPGVCSHTPAWRRRTRPINPAARSRRTCPSTDHDRLQAVQVDHDAGVARAQAGEAVAAAADRHEPTAVVRHLDRLDHVLGGRAASDDRRVAVDHSVEHMACLVVAGIVGREHLARERLAYGIGWTDSGHRFSLQSVTRGSDGGGAGVPRAFLESAPRMRASLGARLPPARAPARPRPRQQSPQPRPGTWRAGA